MQYRKGFRQPPKTKMVDPLQQKFQTALAFHQQGKVVDAKKLYEEILKSNPKHFDALHLSAVIAHQLKNIQEAEDLFKKALALNPDFAALQSNYGNLLKESHRLNEALASYQKAISIEPRDAELHNNCGVALHDLMRFNEALASFDKAITIRPDYAEAHNNRGNTLKELGRFDEALLSYAGALSLRPEYPKAHYNHGVLLQRLLRYDRAIESYDKAITFLPGYAEAYNNRGVILQEMKRFDEALKSYQNAIASKPDFAEAHNNLGNVRNEMNRFGQALESYQSAISLQPLGADFYNNRGNVFRNINQLDQALRDYDKAIEFSGEFAEAHLNRGIALAGMRRFEEAFDSFDRALSIVPDYAEAHWNKGVVHLLNGRLHDGWPLYEWRKKTKDPKGERLFPQPLWRGGEDIRGKTVLVHWEQGLGDSIQFCSYLSLLNEAGATVLFAPPKELRGLMASLNFKGRVVDENDVGLQFDYHIPLLSLPHAFKTDLSKLPIQEGYMKADESRVQAWRSRLGSNGVKIGICWQGSTGTNVDAGRSFSVKQFQALADVPGVRLISLHKGQGETELRRLPEGMIVETLGEDFDAGPDAFLDTAAVMQCCDLVITSDTAVAHLAGALGAPTWVALKHVPDWRWFLDRDDSPWYPTMRLFRQQTSGDWDGVFMRIRDALCERAAD